MAIAPKEGTFLIESISIRGFQRWYEFKLRLDKRITTISGPSNAGKTSVLRALRWISQNRPQGDAFISHGQNRAKATIVADGKKVTRRKGTGVNSYSLDGKRFIAFGTGVPDEIANILNLSDANFQAQHDPPYWFFLSPGEASKALNGIVDLSLVDQVLATAASEVRRIKASVEVSRERSREAKEKQDALAWTQEADAELRIVERLQEAISLSKRKTDGLNTILDRMGHARASVSLFEEASKELERVVAMAESEMENWLRFTSLEKLLDEIEEARRESERWEKIASEKEKILGKATKGACPLCGRK